MVNERQIKQCFLGLGADVCGIAGVERFRDAPAGFHPRDIWADARSVIIFGRAMPRGVLKVEPRLIYMKAMDECLAELDRISFLGSTWIETGGGTAVPVPSDAPYEYWDAKTKTARGMLSMKHAAVFAGLGQIGKNTLLINRHHGNRLMLGCVLTDLALASDPVETKALCPPKCRICLDACPQQALDGVTIDQSRCRDIVYGTNARGFEVCNCNRCREVCPRSFGPIIERSEVGAN